MPPLERFSRLERDDPEESVDQVVFTIRFY
jgi:hypothetical protein